MITNRGEVLDADDLCHGLQQVLELTLPVLAESVGLSKVRTWTQVPTQQALQHVDPPVGAIACPGLTGSPSRDEDGWVATWRLVAAVYDHAEDYERTQRASRRWAALIRAVVLDQPTLCGVATTTRWAGEDYALPREVAARTLAGCAVAFDVDALAPRLGTGSTPRIIRSTELDVHAVPPTSPLE